MILNSNKDRAFTLRNNLSLIFGIFITLIEFYLIGNGRDQYFVILITLALIPLFFHNFPFSRFHLFSDQKYFSILLKSSRYLVPLIYIIVFILIYDYSLIYKYSYAFKAAFLNVKTYGAAFLFGISILGFSLLRKYASIRKLVDSLSVFLGVLFCCFLAYHLLINDLHRYNESFINFSIVVNPIVQVFFGSTVMIDIKSQYGLYPHFFEPLLQITGLSITSISLIMALLFLVTVGSWFIFLLKTTNNSFLSLIGLLSATYISLSLTTLWPAELYYQYFPIRTFFPAIFLLIFSLFYDRRSWYGRIIISSILALGVLWNTESGIGAFLCFIVLDAYLEYDIKKQFQRNFYVIIKNMLISFLTLAIIFLILFNYLEIRSGVMPTLLDYFYYSQQYGSSAIGGTNSGLHLHKLAMILVYFLGISYGIGCLFFGNRDKLNSGIFIISIFGLFGSLYYMFKHYHISHEGLALYPIVILITLFAARLLINFKDIHFLSWQWLKTNQLTLFYLLICVSFLSFHASLFLVGYKNDTNFTTTAFYHEIVDPSSKNNKALGVIKYDNFDSNEYSFDYVKISDIARGNTNNIWPRWVNTYNALEKYKNKSGRIRQDMLIFSMYDAFLYLKLNARMPVKYANSAHLWGDEYDRLDDAIENDENIQYILLDNDELHVPQEERFISMLDIVKEKFDLIESIETGNYIWYNTPNPNRLNKKSWDKHIIEVYKRRN